MTRRSFFGWFASILAGICQPGIASTKLKRHGWQLQPKAWAGDRKELYVMPIGLAGKLTLHLLRSVSVQGDSPETAAAFAATRWILQLNGAEFTACSIYLPVSGPGDAQKRAEAIAVEWGVETAVDLDDHHLSRPAM